jgi:hypothetical protein
MEEDDNTADNQKQHAETFINFLNNAPWKYPQLCT